MLFLFLVVTNHSGQPDLIKIVEVHHGELDLPARHLSEARHVVHPVVMSEQLRPVEAGQHDEEEKANAKPIREQRLLFYFRRITSFIVDSAFYCVSPVPAKYEVELRLLEESLHVVQLAVATHPDRRLQPPTLLLSSLSSSSALFRRDSVARL